MRPRSTRPNDTANAASGVAHAHTARTPRARARAGIRRGCAPAIALSCFAALQAGAATATSETSAPTQADLAPIGYSSVAGARAALEADRTAQFRERRGWTVVASREHGHPVEWFFTPEGHPAHPAVVKRTVVDEGGTGYVDLAVLCQAAQAPCDALLEEFRQMPTPHASVPQPAVVTLDLAVRLNDHDRVAVHRLAAEAGKAAELKMDALFKAVIVPTLGDNGDITVWTALYEYDGSGFTLLAAPQLAEPHGGTVEIDVTDATGKKFGFFITPLAPQTTTL